MADMTYTITNIHTSDRHPGIIYARLVDENGETCIAATIEYIIEAIQERGYVVSNYRHISNRLPNIELDK